MIFLIVAIAAAYQLFALAATLRHLFLKSPPAPPDLPAVSILKPVRGLDAGFAAAIRSHAAQHYPAGFEILFGLADPNDPAVHEIDRLIADFSHIPVRRFVCPTAAPNAKVGVLIDLAAHARHPVWIVNDSDITVPPGYIENVVGPLSNPNIGLVTCLYRAEGSNLPARFEALGIVTDFAPSTLVAPLAGVSEFGLGSTLAFRKADLESIGGFPSIAPYIADDYHLGAKIHALGRRNLISQTVVSTGVHASTWSSVWKHQVRWARTIRVSRGPGYAGLPVTQATLWALLALVTGHPALAACLFALRLAVAFTAGWVLLRSRDVLYWWWLIPARDLYASATWAAGLFGRTVEWRGLKLELDPQGRIVGVY